MKIAIEFKHSRDHWCGRVIEVAGDEFLFAETTFKIPRQPGKRAVIRDRYGVEAAKRAWFWKQHRRFPDKQINSAKGFERQFIQHVQAFMLDEASRWGVLIIPTTHLEEILTVDFIKKLAKRLSKKSDRSRYWRLRNLKMLLLESWEPRQLYRCDRNELRQALQNCPFAKGMSAANIWQTAYRLGLFSDERHGPRPRS